MRMLRTGVNFEFADHFSAETIFRQHTANRVLHDISRIFTQQILERSEFTSSRVTGVRKVLLHFFSFAFYANFLGVYDHYEIAAIDVGRKVSFVLAAKQHGYSRSGSSDHQIFGVDHPPIALYVFRSNRLRYFV